MAMFTYGHSFIAPRHIKIYSKPMITSHKCISAYINKDTLYAFQEKSEFITKMKKEKRSREVFSVLLWGSNLWHLKLEICTSHPDSHGESGYRQVLFPPVGKKKTTSLPSDFKKVLSFFTFNFQRQRNTFQHLSPEKSNNSAVCDSYRGIFLTTALCRW